MKKLQIVPIEGLSVSLDKLVYEYNDKDLPADTPHAFIYFLTISNSSNRTITLLGRKWILQSLSEYSIIEGEKIIGQTPVLAPGESFSYNSYHLASENIKAKGAFYGIDEFNQVIHVQVPEFDMIVPGYKKSKTQNESRRSQ
ncbi:MAG: ApaG domain [Verrucomicrobia bacterium]|nr:MAG: ApaG domain [Verrucomicrobiota bacterium]